MPPKRSPKYDAWFECARGCSGRWPLTEVIYRCPHCEGLLTVQHDMEVLKRTPPQKVVNSSGRQHTTVGLRLGVWGKRRAVCPVWTRRTSLDVRGQKNMFWGEAIAPSSASDDRLGELSATPPPRQPSRNSA